MKNGLRKLRSLILIILCVTMAVPGLCMQTSAASTRQQAMAAYKKWLSKPTLNVIPLGKEYYTGSNGNKRYTGSKPSNVKFALAEIDNDGIPELIVYVSRGRDGLYSILTYRNGKIHRIAATRGSSKILGYYKKTGVYEEKSLWDNGCCDYYYRKIVNGRHRIIASKFINAYMDNLVQYAVNNKESSKEQFKAKMRRAIGGTSKSTFKFYRNTTQNRKARLK